MAKGEAHQAGNRQAACDGDGSLAVPSQLVVQVKGEEEWGKRERVRFKGKGRRKGRSSVSPQSTPAEG